MSSAASEVVIIQFIYTIGRGEPGKHVQHHGAHPMLGKAASDQWCLRCAE